MTNETGRLSRRDFVRISAAMSVGTAMGSLVATPVAAQGEATRIGSRLIGKLEGPWPSTRA